MLRSVPSELRQREPPPQSPLNRIDRSWFVLSVIDFQTSLAHTLLTAPAWARVGLTAPNERLRKEARHLHSHPIGRNQPTEPKM